MIHRRQFIITKKNIVIDDFLNVDWSDGYRVYYSRDLCISCGDSNILIGDAFQVVKDQDKPEEIISERKKITVKDYSTWGGRWILLTDNEVHLDAAGTLGVFYGQTKDGFVISSSLALINDFSDLEEREYEPIVFGRTKMDWFPGPMTKIKGINKLLPSQILRVSEEGYELIFRDSINSGDVHFISVNDTYQKIVESQKILFSNIMCKYPRINLSITGGNDSRLQATMLAALGIPFETHTFERPKATIHADFAGARKISNIVGVKHKYIRIKQYSRIEQTKFDLHTFNNTVDAEREYFVPSEMYDLVDCDIYLKNNLWGIFIDYYARDVGLHIDFSKDYDENIKAIADIFENVCLENEFGKSIRCCLEWMKEHPIDNLTLEERFFYEQRVGCWLSANEQGVDYIKNIPCHIHPACSIYTFSLLAGLPRDNRNKRLFEKEIASLLYPQVAEIPYNKYCGDLIINKIINAVIRYRIKRAKKGN